MTLSQVDRATRSGGPDAQAWRATERHKLERAISVIAPFVAAPATCPLCDGELAESGRCARCGAQL